MIIHFIRHGHPNYNNIKKTDPIFFPDYSPLSELGTQQAYDIDINVLKNSKVILVSPYTRTMHTASIISKRMNKEIIIEKDLHEWLPDKTYQGTVDDFYINNKLYKQKNTYSDDEELNYERFEEMQKRFLNVLDKYKEQYDEIIVVAHQRIISTIIDKQLDFCEVYTFNY